MCRSAGLLLAVILTIVVAQPSFAQAPEDDSGLRANCVGDYFRYCSGYMPGTQAIRSCFSRNIQQLTPACRGAIQKFDRRNSRKDV